MACSAHDIPSLQFPRDEIIEIIPASYSNSSKRIHIDDLPDRILPDSPEGISIPVPQSGTTSPLSGLGTPAGASTPEKSGRETGMLPLNRDTLSPNS